MNISLWTLKAGERCEILGYDQALPENYRTRMMEFGFHPGETVACVQSRRFWRAQGLPGEQHYLLPR